MKTPAKRRYAIRQVGSSEPTRQRLAFFDGRFLTTTDLAEEQNYQRKPGRRPVRRPAVIPERAWRELRMIARCIGNRRSRKRVLFVGPNKSARVSGALAIARDLSLYRIDLAAVSNTYIGETEKNLARLFDRADRTGAVLFFDEADALFARRSEVEDSHDRYANIEASSFLQRLEEFPGTAILAVRQSKDLDAAFLRRFHWIVSFRKNKPRSVHARTNRR